MESSTRAMATEGIAPPSPDKEQLKMMLAARDQVLGLDGWMVKQLQREAFKFELNFGGRGGLSVRLISGHQ